MQRGVDAALESVPPFKNIMGRTKILELFSHHYDIITLTTISNVDMVLPA